MLNHIVLSGRLTKRPELRYTQAGKPVANFTLAVDRDFSSNGEKETDFIDIVAWNKTAELASNYLDKGQQAEVSGRLQIRDWTDRDGNRRKSAEVVADRLYFIGGKKNEEKTGYTPPDDFEELEDDDRRLPF